MESKEKPGALTEPPQLYVQIGPQFGSNRVAIVMINAPICQYKASEDQAEELQLVPAVVVDSRIAMEFGMNLIHYAKTAENLARQQQMNLEGGEGDNEG